RPDVIGEGDGVRIGFFGPDEPVPGLQALDRHDPQAIQSRPLARSHAILRAVRGTIGVSFVIFACACSETSTAERRGDLTQDGGGGAAPLAGGASHSSGGNASSSGGRAGAGSGGTSSAGASA